MRPVLVTDLICAARVVLRYAPERRAEVAKRLLGEADIADHYRRSTGACHSAFGDGTLACAARLSGLAPEPSVCDQDFAAALIVVLRALGSRVHKD